MGPDDELSSEILYDNRLTSYESFFNHQWATDFLAASAASRLHRAGYDLCRDWKGIALVSRMSSLMIQSLESFHKGFTQQHPAFYQRLTALIEHLATKSNLSNMKKKALAAEIEQLSTQVALDKERAEPLIDPHKMWDGFLEIEEFPFALWASQRLAYGSIYYAFENYLRCAVAVAKKDDHYRAKDVNWLKKDLATYFGKPLATDCIDHPSVETARHVRNCLTHNGGRITKSLINKQHSLRIKDDQVQIFPEDVVALFDLLKERASKIADAAQSISTFDVPVKKTK